MKNKKVVELKQFNNFKKNDYIASKKFYNYKPSDMLYNSSGIKTATFPYSKTNKTEYSLNFANSNIENVEGVSYFKQYFPNNGITTHRLLLYGSDKKVYINQMLDDSSDLFWLYNLTFSSAPITLAYKKDNNDAIILASKDEMKIWKTGYSPYTVSNVPIITSMCMNEGVLFCTIKEPAFKIWYATNLDAENVGNIGANSGYISLEDDIGYARKILTLNESVYVFRDYGITKISYYKSNISINQVYSSNTKIYTETVSVCGNVVLFLTKDGLYSFNGVKVSKQEIDLTDLNLNCNFAVASSMGSKYYAALKLDYKDNKQVLCEKGNYVNNALLIFDLDEYTYEILRGVDIKSLLPVKTEEFEKMLITFNTVHTDKLGEIVNKSICIEENLPKYWCSGELVEGLNTKLFTKLSIVADVGVKFKLLYDDKELSFTTYQQGLNKFAFKISCNRIKLEISSNNETANVEKVYLDYYDY